MANLQDKSKGKPSEEGSHQSDLAEGERDTVEQSIRIHEKKGDLDKGAKQPQGSGAGS